MVFIHYLLVIFAVFAIFAPTSYSQYCTVCRKQCGCTENIVCGQKDYQTDVNIERGLPKGRETTFPLISSDFISMTQHDCPCSFLKVDENCQLVDKSGLNIGAGIDIQNWSKSKLEHIGVRQSTIDKLSHLFRVERGNLLEYCKKNFSQCHVELTPEERVELNTLAMAKMQDDLLSQYHSAQRKGKYLQELPRGARTAIYSRYHQLGHRQIEKEDVWQHMVDQDWDKVIQVLRASNDKRQYNESVILEYGIKENCTKQHGDLMYVLDASASIEKENFKLAKDFLYNLTQKLDISEDTLRIGIVVFSTDVTLYLKFSGNKNIVLNTIKSIEYDEEETCTGEALTLVYEEFAKDLRKNVPKDMFIFTDGGSNCDIPVKDPAEKLHALGVNTYAIGIGSDINLSELETIAGNHKNVYLISAYKELYKIFTGLFADICYSPNPIKPGEDININATKGDIRYFVTPIPAPNGVTIKLEGHIPPVERRHSVIYYSETRKNPNKNLRDGEAIFLPNGTWIFSIPHKPNVTHVYYSVFTYKDMPITLKAEEGSRRIKECVPHCLKCDLNGQNCEQCDSGTRLIKGLCEKINDNTWIIIVATVAAFFVLVGLLAVLIYCCCDPYRYRRSKGYVMVRIGRQ